MKGWTVAEMGGDPRDLKGWNGRYYYRQATITWSRPVIWHPLDARPELPDGWAGHGGLYTILRDHHAQNDRRRIAYVGKALSFARRLNRQHHMFSRLVEKPGDTLVSLGRVRFDRLRAHPGYYEELEQIVAWTVWQHLENYAGMSSVPGFRGEQTYAFVPWVILNDGYRFNGGMPRRIAYPVIGVAR